MELRPEVIENRVTVAVELPVSLHRRLRYHCVAHDLTMRAFVIELLTKTLGELPPLEEQDDAG